MKPKEGPQPCMPKERQDPSGALGKGGSNSQAQGSDMGEHPSLPGHDPARGSPAPECCDAQEVKGSAKASKGLASSQPFPRF